MKRISEYIIAVIIIFLLLPACEPELVTSIELPDEDPKLSVSAFLISGNTTHYVYLSNSQPLNHQQSTNMSVIDDANVIISDGVLETTLKYFPDSQGGWYSFNDIDLPVIPGRSYTLKVNAPGYYHQATSECTIPLDFDPQFEIISIDTLLTQNHKTYELVMSFLDPANSDDYYRIAAIAVIADSIPSQGWDTSYLQMGTPASQPLVFTDADRDGSRIQYNFALQSSSLGTSRKLTGFIVHLYRTDREYYLFHRNFINNEYYDQSDNPFGEPIIIPTNIEGGYGVFSGLIHKSLIISL